MTRDVACGQRAAALARVLLIYIHQRQRQGKQRRHGITEESADPERSPTARQIPRRDRITTRTTLLHTQASDRHPASSGVFFGSAMMMADRRRRGRRWGHGACGRAANARAAGKAAVRCPQREDGAPGRPRKAEAARWLPRKLALDLSDTAVGVGRRREPKLSQAKLNYLSRTWIRRS